MVSCSGGWVGVLPFFYVQPLLKSPRPVGRKNTEKRDRQREVKTKNERKKERKGEKRQTHREREIKTKNEKEGEKMGEGRLKKNKKSNSRHDGKSPQ